MEHKVVSVQKMDYLFHYERGPMSGGEGKKRLCMVCSCGEVCLATNSQWMKDHIKKENENNNR